MNVRFIPVVVCMVSSSKSLNPSALFLKLRPCLGFRTKQSYLTAQCGDAHMGPCTRWRITSEGRGEAVYLDGWREGRPCNTSITQRLSTLIAVAPSLAFPCDVRSDSFDGWNATPVRTLSSAARACWFARMHVWTSPISCIRARAWPDCNAFAGSVWVRACLAGCMRCMTHQC